MFERSFEGKINTVAHKLEEAPDISNYYKHIHPFCELLLVVSGNAEFNTDGKIITVKPYDLIIIPQATYHNIARIEPAPYENYVLDFYPDIMPPQYAGKLFKQPKTINIKNDRVLTNFFSLFDLYNSVYDGETFLSAAERLIWEMTVYLAANIEKYKDVSYEGSELVNKILSEIVENPTLNINGDYLAEKYSFSKSYIQNTFSNQMKIGLKHYINQKRIIAAHGDIVNGESPVEVAKKYNYADYTTFYRQYKKIIGVSPSAKQ